MCRRLRAASFEAEALVKLMTFCCGGFSSMAACEGSANPIECAVSVVRKSF